MTLREPDEGARAEAFATAAGGRYPRLMRFAGRRYQGSAFCRRFLLPVLLASAFAARLAEPYFAARLFSSERFGIYFVANTISAILFSGSLVLNIFFIRYLVSATHADSDAVVFARTLRLERVVVRWGGVVSAATLVGMLGIAKSIGFELPLLILLVITDTYTSYVAELGRVVAKAQRRTLLLGSYTLLWSILRLGLCLGGIWLFGTVAGAFIGIIASTLIAYLGIRFWISWRAPGVSADISELPSIGVFIPAILGYGLVMVVSNLDVVLGYLALNQEDLGIYSASVMLPKAMLVLTTPLLLQMLFPMIVGEQPTLSPLGVIIGKSEVATFLLVGAAIAFLWATSDAVCGGIWGMPLCQPKLLNILLVSVLPTALLRLLVFVEFAKGRAWKVKWLVLPTLLYVGFTFAMPRTIPVAAGFAIFGSAAVCWRVLLELLARRRARLQPAT